MHSTDPSLHWGRCARLSEVRAEFEAVWLRHARRSEIHLTLDHFDTLDARYGAAIAWLEDQRTRLANGQTLDTDLATYAPGPYLPWWKMGIEEQRRLRELLGPARPPPEPVVQTPNS